MRAVRIVLGLLALLLLPSLSFAQGAIAGVVRDSSGAVLPGVTVEASSPALIEKVRTSVTDGTGQFNIVSLPPGSYVVTFTLPGFNTVKREGIQLTGSFVASIAVDMRVGALAETITVTGESPLVDVRTAGTQKTITKDVVDAIPTGRLGVSLAALVPGMYTGTGAGQDLTVQDVGGVGGDRYTDLRIHGSKPLDQRQTINGLSVATQIRGGESTSSAPSLTSMTEVGVETSGVDASLPTGGVRLNYIPRDGGNTFSGMLFISGANGSMQGSNYDDELRQRGLSAPGTVEKVFDLNPGFGGPVKRDKLWFFLTYRLNPSTNYVPGNYPNLNAHNTALWTYAPDTSKPQGTSRNYLREETLRLTWQASQKHKISGYYVDKYRCTCLSVNVTTASDAVGFSQFFPFSDQLVEWSAPLTSRTLVEGALFHHQETFGVQKEAPRDLVDPSMIGVSLSSAPPGQSITTYRGRVGATVSPSHNPNFRGKFSVSYVTGAHSVKTGFDHAWAYRWAYSRANQPYSYIFNSAYVPTGLNLRSDYPNKLDNNLSGIDSEGGAYIQDRWTIDRLTLSGGLRFDWFYAHLNETTLGPSLLTPNRNITFAAEDTLGWKDVTPRVGMAYDLFGTGRTAVKVSLGKYVAGQASGGLATAGAVSNVVTTTTRNWNDTFFPVGDPRRGNYVPDCDMVNPAANGECGAFASQNFGRTQPAGVIDPDIRFGWGKRGYNWEFATSVDHQLATGLSMNVGYFRRWYGNFLVTDNRALGPGDYDPFSIVAPTDSRLPNGGQTITGLNAINQVAFLRPADNFQTFASNYGTQSEQWNGMDAALSARLAAGLIFQGGISTGRLVQDNCEIVEKVPESAPAGYGFGTRFCRSSYPFLTQVKFLTSYTIPRIDVQVGATYQHIPGVEVGASHQVPNTAVAASLGRPVAGAVNNAGQTAVQLLGPGAIYGDTVEQVDVRFGKILRFAGRRAVVNFDLFNALNVNPVVSESGNYSNWRTPQAVLPPRLMKVSIQLDF